MTDPVSRRKRAPAYRYQGKGAASFHLPRPLRWTLIALAAVLLVLWGVAGYLQRYMVYSIDGGELVLPGHSQTQEEEPPLTGLVIVEE